MSSQKVTLRLNVSVLSNETKTKDTKEQLQTALKITEISDFSRTELLKILPDFISKKRNIPHLNDVLSQCNETDITTFEIHITPPEDILKSTQTKIEIVLPNELVMGSESSFQKAHSILTKEENRKMSWSNVKPPKKNSDTRALITLLSGEQYTIPHSYNDRTKQVTFDFDCIVNNLEQEGDIKKAIEVVCAYIRMINENDNKNNNLSFWRNKRNELTTTLIVKEIAFLNASNMNNNDLFNYIENLKQFFVANTDKNFAIKNLTINNAREKISILFFELFGEKCGEYYSPENANCLKMSIEGMSDKTRQAHCKKIQDITQSMYQQKAQIWAKKLVNMSEEDIQKAEKSLQDELHPFVCNLFSKNGTFHFLHFIAKISSQYIYEIPLEKPIYIVFKTESDFCENFERFSLPELYNIQPKIIKTYSQNFQQYLKKREDIFLTHITHKFFEYCNNDFSEPNIHRHFETLLNVVTNNGMCVYGETLKSLNGTKKILFWIELLDKRSIPTNTFTQKYQFLSSHTIPQEKETVPNNENPSPHPPFQQVLDNHQHIPKENINGPDAMGGQPLDTDTDPDPREEIFLPYHLLNGEQNISSMADITRFADNFSSAWKGDYNALLADFSLTDIQQENEKLFLQIYQKRESFPCTSFEVIKIGNVDFFCSVEKLCTEEENEEDEKDSFQITLIPQQKKLQNNNALLSIIVDQEGCLKDDTENDWRSNNPEFYEILRDRLFTALKNISFFPNDVSQKAPSLHLHPNNEEEKKSVYKAMLKNLDEYLDPTIQEKILQTIETIVDYEWTNLNIKKLRAKQNEYRCRVGQYRILFKKHEDGIKILDIKNRQDAYKK